MARRVILEAIPHNKCEVGHMFKSTLKDNYGNPVMFAIVNEFGKVNFNSIVFQGICDTCHQEFTASYSVESFLAYKEVA